MVRIGVLREAFGDDQNPRAAPVNNVVETAVDVMVEMGAELVDPVTIPDLEEQIGATTVYSYYGTLYLNEFLAQREAIPYDSVTEICEAGAYHERLELLESNAEMTDDPEEVLDFWRSSLGQESFRRDVLNTFAAADLDAIVFPDVHIPPTMSDLSDRYTTANFPTNTPIGAQTQCPAISIPGGLTDDGLPVGVELLGKPYQEHRLIEMAYAYEQATDTRQLPETTPPLEAE